MRKFVVSALTALCLAAPAAAEEVTVYVTHSDLNLASAAGVETLEARIAEAVKSVCAKPETIRDLKAMAAWEACKTDATTNARAQVATTIELASL